MIFQIKNNLQYILFELKPFLENYCIIILIPKTLEKIILVQNPT